MAKNMLKHDFPRVIKGNHTSFGGSQMRSENPVIKRCGCGLVAACDLLLYLHQNHKDCNCPYFEDIPPSEPIELAVYNSLLEKLKSFFLIIPPFGINVFMLVTGINLFFKRFSYPYHAAWAMNSSALWRRIDYMLERDIPVIISVGPNLPLIWQKNRANLYTQGKTEKYRSSSVKAHFMTVTAMDDEWIEVSSWGRKYYINKAEYMEYVQKHSSSLVCNIVYITRK